MRERLGTFTVILDGHQRFTTLYKLVSGSIPSLSNEEEIQIDPRDLGFNLEEGEFQCQLPSNRKGNALWHPVVRCHGRAIDVFEFTQGKAANDGEVFELAQRYNENVNRLRSIREMNLLVQTVPWRASTEEPIEIFDRVNSQGTKLTDAEIALAHVTRRWPEARKIMKQKLMELQRRHFEFNFMFVKRALTGVVTQWALFRAIDTRAKEELSEGWQKLGKILDYLVRVLRQRARIHSTEDLNSTKHVDPNSGLFVPQ